MADILERGSYQPPISVSVACETMPGGIQVDLSSYRAAPQWRKDCRVSELPTSLDPLVSGRKLHMQDTQRKRRRAQLLGVLALTALVAASPQVAHAAGSAPTLAITGVSAYEGSGGTSGATVQGTFNYEDLLQFSYPAGVILFRGNEFTRYDLSGAIISGVSTLVSDGIVDLDVIPLLSIGAASGAPASVVKLRPGEISVALPAGFSPGLTSAILYGVVNDDLGSPGPGTAFVSNTVQFLIQ